MAFDDDTLQQQQQVLPYLTSAEQEIVWSNLKTITSGGSADYFLSPYHDEFKDRMLQGDGHSGFQLFNFETGKSRSIKGLVLSNSCDISPDNPRPIPSRIIFAPLVKLATYRSLLEKNCTNQKLVKTRIKAIRMQRTTNIFYLPAGGPLGDEYIVRFDEVQSMPMARYYDAQSEKKKLFTLNDTGFYMLIFKLSIHFCRFQEDVRREDSE